MNNFFAQILFVLRKYFIRILAFSIVFIIAFCTISYFRSFQSASAILAFKFPNASDGLYPNGTFLNAYNIFTDEVLSKGIRNAGLDGYVHLSNISNEITIRPRSSASLITTQFIVSYEAGKDDILGPVNAEGLLHSILYSYIGHFHEIYSNDQISLNWDLIDAGDMEYIDIIEYYNMYLNQLQKYLRSQQESNKDFVSGDGTSFQDLINIIEQFRLTYLEGISAIITERGVTVDRDTYIERLNYRTGKYQNTYDYNRKMNQLYKQILQDYEARLTSVVFIPSLDSSRKFYMSKTKIGVDILANNATKYEEAAAEVQRLIDQSNQYIAMITDDENTSLAESNNARVVDMMTQLRNYLNETINKIQLVEKEYSQYKNHSYVTITPIVPSLSQRIQAKTAVLLAAAIDVILVIALAILKKPKKGEGLK